MKKFYGMLFSLLVVANLFAADPTATDLSSYAEEGYYVACFSVPNSATDSTCNDIVWAGTYNAWNVDDVNKLIKCEPLTGFEGWYVAKVPVDTNKTLAGKPVQLNNCGQFNWNYQLGRQGRNGENDVEKVSGPMTIGEGYDKAGDDFGGGKETNLEGYTATEPSIFKVKKWTADPCPEEGLKTFTIWLADPACDKRDDNIDIPYIQGSFDSWKAVHAMKSDLDTFYTFGTEDKDTAWYYFTYTICGMNFGDFAWSNDTNKDNWDNKFWYKTEDGSWKDCANFTLTKDTSYLTKINDTTFLFDLSDITKYRYGLCVDTTKYDVLVSVKLPTANVPDTVEMVGSWGEKTWEVGEVMTIDNGSYTATIKAAENHKYQFRGKGSWDVKLQIKKDTAWSDVGDLIVESTWNTTTHNITLDYSDAAKYRWTPKQPSTAVNNILSGADAIKPRKVVINGTIYIQKGNELYDIFGTPVK